MHLNEFEKSIYNEYLRAQRKGKPFTPRKDFSEIEDEQFVLLKQLASFFASFSNIKPRDFFNAGFANSDYQPLNFFKTLKAIKLYNIYIAEQLSNADEEWTINFVKESMVFIFTFCRDNNIAVDKYLDITSPAGLPWFVVHLKELKVCLFALFAIQDFENKLYCNIDDVAVVLGDEFLKELPKHRTNFFASKKCKNIARQGLNLIKQTNKPK